MKRSTEATSGSANTVYPEDPDELYFEAHPESRSRLRPAFPGEWPEGNELFTSPPHTLVIQIAPRQFLKMGAWRGNADLQNTVVQLNQGRFPISRYLERAGRKI